MREGHGRATDCKRIQTDFFEVDSLGCDGFKIVGCSTYSQSAASQPGGRPGKPLAKIVVFGIKSTFRTDFTEIHVSQKAIQACLRCSLLLLPLRLFEPAPYGRVTVGKLLYVNAIFQADRFGPGNPLNDGLKPEACAWRQHLEANLMWCCIDS